MKSTTSDTTTALEALERDLSSMADLVETQLDAGIAAVTRRDVVLADEVLRGDDAIDQWDVRIEEAALGILSTTKLEPVALRVVVASARVVTQLERVGDLAVNLAERSLALASREPLSPMSDLAAIAARVQRMVRSAVQSLVTRDPALARSVLATDEVVDEAHRTLFATLERIMRADPDSVESGILMLSCSRYLERIGDHAKNVAEDAIYLVEGKIVRHARSRVTAPGDAMLIGAR